MVTYDDILNISVDLDHEYFKEHELEFKVNGKIISITANALKNLLLLTAFFKSNYEDNKEFIDNISETIKEKMNL